MSENGQVKPMAFYDILRAIGDGKRVTRLSWNDKRHYCHLKDGLLQLHKAGESDNTFHAWLINDGDLYGEDWVVIPQ